MTLAAHAAGTPDRTDRRAWATGLVFVLSVGLFLHAWYASPNRPSLHDYRITGWYSAWADQLNYARETRALAEGHLPGTHWDYSLWQAKPAIPLEQELSDYAYGLGYPLIGAPFAAIGVKDPFLLPDCLAFACLICMALALARRVLSENAALVYAVALAVWSPVLLLTVVPWNTTVTAIAVMTALLVATSNRRDWKTGVGLGAALSLCYAARFTDVVWPLAIAASGLLITPGVPRSRALRVLAPALAMLAATFAAVGWTQHVVFGSFLTNPYHYHMHNGFRGDVLSEFHLSQVPRAFIEVFVTGRSNGVLTTGLYVSVIRAFPWLVAAPIGMALLVRSSRPHRVVLLVAVAASIAASTMYLSYWSGTGADLQNGNERFFAPWFPFWGLLAALGVAGLIDWVAPSLHLESVRAATRLPAAVTGTSLGVIALAIVLAGALLGERRPTIDLLHQFDKAEKRPVSAQSVFGVEDITLNGRTEHAMRAPEVSRATWLLDLPPDSCLRTEIALDARAWTGDGSPVVFRVAVIDAGKSHELFAWKLDPAHVPGDRGWMPILADLAAFGGHRVQLVFSTNPSTAAPMDPQAWSFWGAPTLTPRPYFVVADRAPVLTEKP